MKRKPIYVEIPIRTEMDQLWEASQNPTLHEQWDLRFSSITYLPKKAGEPQLFSYRTKIGLGLEIEGWGKSVGHFEAEDGARTSSLHFGTDQRISLIREGRGYWKYQKNKHPDTITFLTQYDYETRFGRMGHWIDRVFFRPLIGWATALSFDVLKRWLEHQESPASQYIRFFTHTIVSILFMFIWLYHGLVPKLLNRHPEEISMVERMMGFHSDAALWVVIIAGIAEVIFGMVWIFYRNKRRLFALQLFLFPLLTFSVLLADSNTFTHPFNPFTFNLALFALSIVGYINGKDVPTATRCKRKRQGVSNDVDL